MKDGMSGRRGNVILEFTLVGIPVMFVLISVFEVSRGMWVYHSLAHAVREASRYAIVNGKDCAAIKGPPPCAVSIADVAQRIRDAGVGLSPAELEVTMQAVGPSGLPATAPNATVQCNPLSQCLTRTGEQWPPEGANRPKVHAVVIQGVYPFRSAIAMFWPGAGGGMRFGTFRLPAMSMEMIQF